MREKDYEHRTWVNTKQVSTTGYESPSLTKGNREYNSFFFDMHIMEILTDASITSITLFGGQR